MSGIIRVNPLITGDITYLHLLTKWDDPPSGPKWVKNGSMTMVDDHR